MKTNILLITVFLILYISRSLVRQPDCEGQIKYYYKGKLQKGITFKNEYYIAGDDCAMVRGERVIYDSIVITPQAKK